MEMNLMRELSVKKAAQAANSSPAASASKTSNSVLNTEGDSGEFSAKLSSAMEKKTPVKSRETAENKMTYAKKDMKKTGVAEREEAEEDETPNTLQSTIAAPILGLLAQNAAETPISVATNIAIGAIGQAVTSNGVDLDNNQMMQAGATANSKNVDGASSLSGQFENDAIQGMDARATSLPSHQASSASDQSRIFSSQTTYGHKNSENVKMSEQDAKADINLLQSPESIPMRADQSGAATGTVGQIAPAKDAQLDRIANQSEPATVEHEAVVQNPVVASYPQVADQVETVEVLDRSDSILKSDTLVVQDAIIVQTIELVSKDNETKIVQDIPVTRAVASASPQESSLKVDRADQVDSPEQFTDAGTTEPPVVSTEKSPEHDLQNELDQGSNLLHEEKTMAAKHVEVMTSSFDNAMRTADAVAVTNRSAETPRIDRYEIVRQVMDGLQTSTDRLQTSQVIITLRPEHLGEVTVKINVDGDKVTAAFHAANAEVRSILEGSLPQFKQDMSQQGWNFDSEGIYSAMKEFMGSGQNQQSQQFQQQELQHGRQKQESYDDAFAFGSTGSIQVMSASAVDYRI